MRRRKIDVIERETYEILRFERRGKLARKERRIFSPNADRDDGASISKYGIAHCLIKLRDVLICEHYSDVIFAQLSHHSRDGVCPEFVKRLDQAYLATHRALRSSRPAARIPALSSASQACR